MAEIPYFFETPIPKYFRESGWFSNANTVLFVTWAFSKCSTQARTIVHDHKEITLQPFEFITGRGTSSADSLLSVEAFRHQLNSMQKAGLLKKTPNSAPNRYTCYRWVTERFSKDNPQLNPRLTPNSPPTEPPQSRRKKERSKEDHPLTPSLQKGDDDDDSLSKKKNKKADEPLIQVYKEISMTQKDLDKCIEIKGSIEEVRRSIEYITNHPGRKSNIRSWPNAMKTWNIPNHVKSYMQEHEEMGKRLDRDFSTAQGWRCFLYNDRQKDQKGILFECTASVGNHVPIFIAFHDKDFIEKASKVLREKKMQKGRETKT